MVYWKCSGLCTFFFKTSTWYTPIVYALFHSYLDFEDQELTVNALTEVLNGVKTQTHE